MRSIKFLDKEQPLGLPAGSCRALISLAFTGATIYCVMQGIDVVDTLLPITTLIIGYYFGNRSSE